MKIATYANARTALEARKGMAPAFMCGECPALNPPVMASLPRSSVTRRFDPTGCISAITSH